MAGKAKVLEARLILGGTLDPSFDEALLAAQKKINSYGKDLERVGKAFTKGVTVPIVAFGTAAVKTFVDFDDSMRQVAAVTGATGRELKALSEAARAAGAGTRYAASEAAEALYYMGLAGWDAGKSMEALPKVLNLAAAGNMDLALASDLVTDGMAALGLGIGDLDVYIDQMAQTSRKSNTDVAQLGEAILSVGGTAKMMSGGITEMNTTLGVLANRGIKGSEGGVKLRNILLSLAAPTDKATELMAELGVAEADFQEALDGMDVSGAQAMMEELGFSAFTAEGRFRPILEIFQELNEVTSSMSDAERSKVLSTIFNKRDLAAVEGLLAALGGEFNALEEDIDNSRGAAGEMATALESGIGGAFRGLKSAWEEAQIALGEKAAPYVEAAAEWLSGVALSVAGMDPDKMRATVDFFLGLAGVGPALFVAGMASKGVGSLIQQVRDFMGGKANPGAVSSGLRLLEGIAGFAVAHPGVALGAAAVGLGALLWQLDRAEKAAYNEAVWSNLEEHFGNITLSVEQVDALAESAKTAHSSGILALAAGAEQLKGLTETFEVETGKLSGLITTAFLTGDTLSETEKNEILAQSEAVIGAVQASVKQAWTNSKGSLEMLLGGDEATKGAILAVYNGYFNELSREAAETGNKLRGTLMAAMAGDGTIDAGEKETIDALVAEYIAIQQKAAARIAAYEKNKILARYSMGSLDKESFEVAQEALLGANKVEEDALFEAHVSETAQQMSLLDDGVITQEQYDKNAAAFKAGYERELTEIRTSGAAQAARLLSMQIEGVLGNYEQELAAGFDADELVSIIATNLKDYFGEGWEDNEQTRRFVDDYLGDDWLENKLLHDYSYTDENGTSVMLQDAFKKMLEAIEPGAPMLYEARDAAIAAGQAVPEDVAKGIADYESLKAITGSTEDMYAWMLEALGGSALKDSLYAAAFAMGAGVSEAFAQGVESGLGGIGFSGGIEVESWGKGSGMPEQFHAYADGGTVTSPTLGLFGEAGAETIIPHRHDANTLSLLKVAAQGSGFGMGGAQIYLTSAPVIHTNAGEAGIMNALRGHAKDITDMITREMDRRRATVF